jgi:hypothetical protein
MNEGWHKNDDENLALAIQEKKGNFKKISFGESASQDGKNKDMGKFKFFACHKFGNYAWKYMNTKKGGNKTRPEVAGSEKTQTDEFCKNFEHT